jgi:hypothetical protein
MSDDNNDDREQVITGPKTVTGEWGTATLHEDGSMSADHPACKVERTEDSTRITLKKLNKLTIDNIVDVRSHSIQEDETAISHHVVFRDGCEVRFSYRHDGKLLEFNARGGCGVVISKDGAITIGVQTTE